MPQRTRLQAWAVFWAVLAVHLAVAIPLLGMEAAVILTMFQTGLAGGALTAALRERRR